MPRPRYEEFKFSTDISPATIDSLVKKREVGYFPTGASHEEAEQALAVYVTPPTTLKHEASILHMPAWSEDEGNPSNARLDAYVAEATGRPVISPNAPGVDYSWWRHPNFELTHLLTPDQYEELTRGSFQKTGAAVMRAAQQAAKYFRLSPEFVMHSSSMGVAMAASAIRATFADQPVNVNLGGIVLAEGVNMSERPLPALVAQFLWQNRHAASYLAQNPADLADTNEPAKEWLKRTVEARRANSIYARALARAGFCNDLGHKAGSALADLQVPVHMTRGTASRLCDAAGYATAVRYLEWRGVPVQKEQFDGHDHVYTLTLHSIVEAVNKVASS